MIEFVTFRGKKLVDIIDAANAGDTEKAQMLQKYFSVTKTAEGKIERRLFPFNYMNIFAPKTPREVKEMLKGYVAEEQDGGNDRGSGKSDDTPF